jgi:uncharacterized protein HemX
MDRIKLILIAVAVSLAITLVVVFYRMGIAKERTSDIKTEIALHKANALELLKQAKNKDKQNQRLLKEINGLQCEIEVIELRLINRNKQIYKLKQDVQTTINAYVADTNRIKLFTELIK